MTQIKKMIIYHAGCPDGNGAAFAFYKKFGRTGVTYHAMKHADKFALDVTGKDVYMADLALKRNVINEIIAKANSLTILDHHISEYEELKDLECYNFSSNHSGAMMSWMYLFPNIPAPKMIQYIEDRDLHNFKLPNTLEVLSALDSLDFSFEKWNAFSEELEIDSISVITRGSSILQYCQTLIKMILRSKFKVNIDGHIIPIVNTAFFKSESASQLSENQPFGASYNFDGKFYWISLRADDKSEIDLSKLAAKFGGGGHKKAAAFHTLSLEQFLIKD